MKLLILLGALSFLAYWPTFNNGFISDDCWLPDMIKPEPAEEAPPDIPRLRWNS